MALIECFAVVCHRATSNFAASTFEAFPKPIWISEGLSRCANNIALATLKGFLSLFKGLDAARDYNRNGEPLLP